MLTWYLSRPIIFSLHFEKLILLMGKH